jgi:hypothetical protein
MVDYKGEPHFVVKTGRRNIRILKPGLPYEKSIKVPLKSVSNRRPADIEQNDEDEVELEDDVELTYAAENEELADQFQPQ